MRCAAAPRCCGTAVALALIGIAATAAAQTTDVPALLVGATLDVRWATGPDVVAAPPAFDERSAFLVTRDHAVVALDLDTGAERWRASLAATFAPASGDGIVFVVADGTVHALAADTGATRWRRRIDGEPAAPPYFDTGWLMLSTANGDVIALRASDGAPIWRQPLGAPLTGSPAPAGDRLYLGLVDGHVAAVELATGRSLWSIAVEGTPTALTALDEQLLIGTSAGALVSAALDSGRVRWRWRPGAPIVGAPIADAKRIYVAGFDHILRALDRGNGALRWRRPLAHRPAGGPLLLGATVFMPSLSTELEGFNAATGDPATKVSLLSEVIGPAHLRAGGRPTGTRVTAVSTEGHFLAFGLRIEPPPVPLTELPGELVPEPPPPPPPPPQAASPPSLR